MPKKMEPTYSYGDLFISVRQRVAAYKLYVKFYNEGKYGVEEEDEYLDNAYRFLNSYAGTYSTLIKDKFLLYCAKCENMKPKKYIYENLLGEE